MEVACVFIGVVIGMALWPIVIASVLYAYGVITRDKKDYVDCFIDALEIYNI